MSIHVLFAEDDNFQRLAVTHILQLCNYQVTAVENGRIARDILLKQDQKIDIVLLDIRMPEMDALELLSFMQEHSENLQKIPVVIISLNDLEIQTFLERGAKDFIIKPMKIQNAKAIAKYVQIEDQGDKNSDISRI
ncbi:response regulator receiver domain protein (macronuclear) [Tetrahymena thermophila SB210]|uniref:Response regulator receiver domain protein n=1 Tax=Tetrahymena thermophila (strain SB210) TaxID=312017 RepID=Q22TX4_TETTS|nr:response regulator receiver domain protein [Tetrahymena thermophila SB210]EAR88913.1 response regulator receiver domain protein [Tetrahymena thermophila SB210]|eukprot:XP_001009158.1 response regulator receiver domain protein [Tetrahymena thermophila SB210]